MAKMGKGVTICIVIVVAMVPLLYNDRKKAQL